MVAECVARLFAPFHLGAEGISFSAEDRRDKGIREFRFKGVDLWARDHPDRLPIRTHKPRLRIVVGGDSILEPLGVPARFGALPGLEARLIRSGLDVEVVNLSESGFDVMQSTALIRKELAELEPDVILLGVSPNDLVEYEVSDGHVIDRATLTSVESRRAAGGLAGFLHRNSYLDNWLWLVVETRRFETRRREVSKRRVRERILAPIDLLYSDLDVRDIPLGIICLPWLDRLEYPDSGCPFRQLETWASERDVPLLDPAAELRQRRGEELAFDDMHLSRRGHDVLAGVITNWMQDSELLYKPD